MHAYLHVCMHACMRCVHVYDMHECRYVCKCIKALVPYLTRKPICVPPRPRGRNPKAFFRNLKLILHTQSHASKLRLANSDFGPCAAFGLFVSPSFGLPLEDCKNFLSVFGTYIGT